MPTCKGATLAKVECSQNAKLEKCHATSRQCVYAKHQAQHQAQKSSPPVTMKNGDEGDSPRPPYAQARDSALEEAPTVCADAMLTRARLGPTPTEEAKEELRKYQQFKYNAEVYGNATDWLDAKEEWLKYQQLQQKFNEEYNAEVFKESTTDYLERRATDKRRDPMLNDAEVTYKQMCAMYQARGEDLHIDQLRAHWDNLLVIKEDNRMEPTSGYTKASFSTMCAMLRHRGVDLSEAQLEDQWNYLKEMEGDEVQEEPMLCAQGCGQPVRPNNKKYLSQEAQNELLRRSCCAPCWMNAYFPKEYVTLGWNRREHDHGGACLKALLNEA